jgi:hypothetical protein
LNLSLERGPLRGHLQKLYQELSRRGLRCFRPEIYLSSEWCTVEGETLIGVPFYLAHPRLARLERKFLGEIEGGTPEWFMMLLRHEAGHCFDHAYRLSATREWRALFGESGQTYDPDHYEADVSSRDFVTHLPDAYAQAHPDEDFAETFAVWLTPRSDWRRRYADAPVALAKLEYIERIAWKLGDEPPFVAPGTGIHRVERLSRTLGAHYHQRVRFEARASRGKPPLS